MVPRTTMTALDRLKTLLATLLVLLACVGYAAPAPETPAKSLLNVSATKPETRYKAYLNTGLDAAPAIQEDIGRVERGLQARVDLPFGKLTLRRTVWLDGLRYGGAIAGCGPKTVLLIDHDGAGLATMGDGSRYMLWGITVRDLQLTRRVPATAATPHAFGIAHVGSPLDAARGWETSLYACRFLNLRLDGFYTAIGLDPLTPDMAVPFWGNVMDEIVCNGTYGTVLNFGAGKANGQPKNYVGSLSIYGAGGAGYEDIRICAGSFLFVDVNRESGNRMFMAVYGGGETDFLRLRFEHTTLPEGVDLIRVANGPVTIWRLALGDVGGTGTRYVLNPIADGTIEVKAGNWRGKDLVTVKPADGSTAKATLPTVDVVPIKQP